MSPLIIYGACGGGTCQEMLSEIDLLKFFCSMPLGESTSPYPDKAGHQFSFFGYSGLDNRLGDPTLAVSVASTHKDWPFLLSWIGSSVVACQSQFNVRDRRHTIWMAGMGGV